MIFARAGYTADEIKAALTASKRRIRFRYELLDKNLKYKRDIKTVSQASIYFDSTASIMRMARLSLKEDGDIDYMSARVRPVFGLDMGDVWAEWPLGVFVLSSPERSANGTAVYRDIEAYDLNQLLKTDGISERIYFRAGTRYTDAVLNVLYGAGVYTPNIASANDVLRADKEYAIGSYRLDIINELLSAINYTPIFPDENGVYTAYKARDVELGDIQFLYTTKSDSVILDGTKEKVDYYSIPNRFIAYVSNPDADPLYSVYENDDPTSVFSTRNRPVVTQKAPLNDISSQKELDAYVKQWAKDATAAPYNIEFSSGLMPMHGYKDVYQFTHDVLGVNEIYQELAWSMELKAGGTMTHNARMVLP